MNLTREHKNLIIQLAKLDLAETNREIWMVTSREDTDQGILEELVARRANLIRVISECNN